MKWLLNFFASRKPVLVKVLTANVLGDMHKEGTLYYYLYENRYGKRSYEYKCTLDVRSQALYEYSMRNKQYTETIYPWLKGRNNPEIPKFSDIPENDTMNYLSGKAKY